MALGASGGIIGIDNTPVRYSPRASGMWNLKEHYQSKLLNRWPVKDVEQGLSLTTSQTTSNNIATDYGTVNTVFAADILFPLTAVTASANGLLFETGGTGTGTFVGIRANGSTFRVRAGNGASVTTSTAQTAVLDIDITRYKDLNSHTVVWEYNVTNSTVKLWIDGDLQGTGTATTAFFVGRFAGTDDGAYFQNTISAVPTGEVTGRWIGSVSSNLRIYTSQLANG